MPEQHGEEDLQREIERHIRNLHSSDLDTQSSAAFHLLGIGEPAVKSILELLSVPDVDVRLWAIWIIDQIMSPQAVLPLLHILNQDPDPQARRAAAEALGDIEDTLAVLPLVEALQHEDPEIREAAAESLGEIGDDRAVEPLCRLLAGDRVVGVRQIAALSLGELQDYRAVTPLIQALQHDTGATVRRDAAWSLGEIGDLRAQEALLKALQMEKDSEVREVLESALEKLEGIE